MVGWYHRHDGHGIEQALGVGKGQGSLVCCSPWGHKESDMTEWLNSPAKASRNRILISGDLAEWVWWSHFQYGKLYPWVLLNQRHITFVPKERKGFFCALTVGSSRPPSGCVCGFDIFGGPHLFLLQWRYGRARRVDAAYWPQMISAAASAGSTLATPLPCSGPTLLSGAAGKESRSWIE